MKILFVDTYYPRFLDDFWSKNADLKKANYSDIKKKIFESNFGTSNFYSRNIRRLGHIADDIIVNDQSLQFKWAEENGVKFKSELLLSNLSRIPFIGKYFKKPDWIQDIAIEQIKKYKPEIVYMQDLSVFTPNTLRKIKKMSKMLVGQIACPLPDKGNLKCFDLIITSFPHYVTLFKKMGIRCEYLKLAFEKKILAKVFQSKKIYDVSFVGSFGPHHLKATQVLEKVAREIPIHVWGQGFEFLNPGSPLRKNFHRESCFGNDLFKVLSQSKIVLNRHIDVADGYANNMRLFESTAMGALLITDRKKNLNDLFKVDKEIVDYSNYVDLTNKIKYYLEHEKERKKIARAGQNRTINYHNYSVRMKELVNILKKHFAYVD